MIVTTLTSSSSVPQFSCGFHEVPCSFRVLHKLTFIAALNFGESRSCLKPSKPRLIYYPNICPIKQAVKSGVLLYLLQRAVYLPLVDHLIQEKRVFFTEGSLHSILFQQSQVHSAAKSETRYTRLKNGQSENRRGCTTTRF